MDVIASHKSVTDKGLKKKTFSLYDIQDLMEERKYFEAAQVAESILSTEEKTPEVLLATAKAFKGNKDYKSEQACLEELLEKENQSSNQYLLAECLISQLDFPEALKTFHDIIDKVPSNDPILFDVFKSMGNIYLKCGDIAAAEEKYNKASRLNAKEPSLIVNYGVLSIQKGDYADAKERFTEIVNKDDSNDIAWVGLALVHRAYSDFDLARACLLRALDENPVNSLAVTHYYQWCVEDGVDASLDFLQTYLNIYPNDKDMLNLLKKLQGN